MLKIKVGAKMHNNSKKRFSFDILPRLWVASNLEDRYKKVAIKHNQSGKYTKKMIYNYVSLYIIWLVFDVHITFGKQ